jgi:hypothetical protein
VSFRTVVVAARSYTVVNGRRASVTLRLSHAGLKLLEHARHDRLRVQATATTRGRRAVKRTITLQL